jgi:hypothetical protein
VPLLALGLFACLGLELLGGPHVRPDSAPVGKPELGEAPLSRAA